VIPWLSDSGEQMVKFTKRQIRQLKTALHWKIPEKQRRGIRMVLLREKGAQPAIAEAMGVSLSTVNRAHMAYDHGGIRALKPKPSGGRHGWRKLMPRPFHPKRDVDAQNAFKKTAFHAL
jgi:hypothetical protein